MQHYDGTGIFDRFQPLLVKSAYDSDDPSIIFLRNSGRIVVILRSLLTKLLTYPWWNPDETLCGTLTKPFDQTLMKPLVKPLDETLVEPLIKPVMKPLMISCWNP